MRILVADDMPLDRSMLRLSLEKWDYEVVEAENGSEALEILTRDDAPSLAILDWMMPGISGPDICQEIRYGNRSRYTYILLLTSKDDTDDLIEGMQSGADDYIVKPVNLHELQVRLRAGKRIIELQDELIATREELRVQATRDFLTGIWNRGVITERLNEEINRAARANGSLGIIMCDIDHFKEVNDTHGHPAGDSVLIEIALRMQANLRAYDALGRFGGEEFLIVAPDASTEGIVALAERIRSAIEKKPIETSSGPISVTVSLGTIVRIMEQNTSLKGLIDEVDRALYRAKESGRNRVESADAVLRG
ncbi:MAG: diguanylate cyclase [Candidatus Hydrogenedentes bacterium]|nr:diguanylate cyclase [Candidatus Hydrogenedentota bacterium]